MPHHVGQFCHPCAREVHKQTVLRVEEKGPLGPGAFEYGGEQRGRELQDGKNVALAVGGSGNAVVGVGCAGGYEGGGGRGYQGNLNGYGGGGNAYDSEAGPSTGYRGFGRGGNSRRGGRRGGIGRGNSRRGHHDRTEDPHSANMSYTANWVNNTNASANTPDMRGLRPDGTFQPMVTNEPAPIFDPCEQWEPNTLESAHYYTGFSAPHHAPNAASNNDTTVRLGPGPEQSFSTSQAQFNAHMHSFAEAGIPAQGYGQPYSVGLAAGFHPDNSDILQIRRDMRPQNITLAGSIWHTHPSNQMPGEWMPTDQQEYSDSVRGTTRDPGWDYVGYYIRNRGMDRGQGYEVGREVDGDEDPDETPTPLAPGWNGRPRSAPTERNVSTRGGIIDFDLILD